MVRKKGSAKKWRKTRDVFLNTAELYTVAARLSMNHESRRPHLMYSTSVYTVI